MFKEKFSALLKSMHDAGHSPKDEEFKAIVLSHATKKKKSAISGMKDTIMLPDSKQLTEYFVKAEMSKYDWTKKSKVHPESRRHAIRLNTTIPFLVHTAYCNLPEDIDELKTIEDFVIDSGQLIEKQ